MRLSNEQAEQVYQIVKETRYRITTEHLITRISEHLFTCTCTDRGFSSLTGARDHRDRQIDHGITAEVARYLRNL